MGMSRTEMLLLQREFCWDKEEWIVPLSATLDGLSAQQAAWKPAGGGNSIWETVRHMNYYNKRVLQRLAGEAVGQADENAQTFIAEEAQESEDEWRAECEDVHRLSAELHQAIAGLSESDLEKPYGSSTTCWELAAWVLHDAYHSGQIVLLRKQQGIWRN
ncbi:DinB family protein [Paenibacillus sp. GCM10027627]